MNKAGADILVADLIQAMFQDAEQATDEIESARLLQDAENLKAIWERTRYALAPTRDAMVASVGNAYLNIADRLDKMNRVLEQLVEHDKDTTRRRTNVDRYMEQLPEERRSQLIELVERVPGILDRLDAIEAKIRDKPPRRRKRPDDGQETV